MHLSAPFLLTTILVVLAPGSGVVYTLSAGLSRGRRAGVVAAIGCTIGIIPHVLATVLGVAALLNANATAFQVLKWAGVAYLLYLAWNTVTDRSNLLETVADNGPTTRKVISSAVLINLLNPKLTIFFLAFLPQFIVGDSAYATAQMLGLSGVFMLLSLIVFIGYGIAAAAVSAQLRAHPRALDWLRRIFAGSFVLLGLRLALTEH